METELQYTFLVHPHFLTLSLQEMACQEVTQSVLDIAMMDPHFKKGRNNPTKGFGRSDQKLRPGLGSCAAPPVSVCNVTVCWSEGETSFLNPPNVFNS